MDALAKLHLTVSKAYQVNPNIKFEVFIHKVDGLTDDHRIGMYYINMLFLSFIPCLK